MGPHTLPTAWYCPKCGLDHHNSGMLTCRRPNCGGCNPTKAPMVPSPPQGRAAPLGSHSSASPSYSFVVQQPTTSQPPNPFSTQIQSVTTPAMLKNITRLGF
eukprot:495894-Karenia_brevis.AAC.1